MIHSKELMVAINNPPPIKINYDLYDQLINTTEKAVQRIFNGESKLNKNLFGRLSFKLRIDQRISFLQHPDFDNIMNLTLLEFDRYLNRFGYYLISYKNDDWLCQTTIQIGILK